MNLEIVAVMKRAVRGKNLYVLLAIVFVIGTFELTTITQLRVRSKETSIRQLVDRIQRDDMNYEEILAMSSAMGIEMHKTGNALSFREELGTAWYWGSCFVPLYPLNESLAVWFYFDQDGKLHRTQGDLQLTGL